MNGLGNSLPHFTRQVLTACLLSDRACFSQRDNADCPQGADCVHVDPGLYLGTWGSMSWRLTDAVRQARDSRDVVKLDLHFSTAFAGFEDPSQKLAVNGPLDVLTLLQHPAVREASWVTLNAPSLNGQHDVNALWRNASEVKINGWWDGCIAAGPIDHAVEAAVAQQVTACPVYKARQCLARFFQQPTPALQSALVPHVARLDAARAAGGAEVCVHVRSGYADHVTSLTPVAPDQTGTAGAVLMSSAPPPPVQPSQATLWRQLDDTYPPCPELNSTNGTNVASPPAPQPDRPPCLEFTGPAKSAMSTGAASCAVLRNNSMHAGNISAGVARAFLDIDAGGASGVTSSFMACAATWAESASPAGPGAPFLVFVAGDLPPLFVLANLSSTLSGHIDTAEGAFGHVSFAKLCRGNGAARECSSAQADPMGAWTRAFVDLYMIGSCDRLLRLGGSSYIEVALARRPHSRGPDEMIWSYTTEPRTAQRAVALARHLAVDALVRALSINTGVNRGEPAPLNSPPATAVAVALPGPAAPKPEVQPSHPNYNLSVGECLVAQSATWGLGSQLITLLHAIVHVPRADLFWDFGPSPYTCCQSCPHNGWAGLFDTNVTGGLKLLPDHGVVELEQYKYFAQRTMTFTDPEAAHNVTCKQWWTLSLASWVKTRLDPKTTCTALCDAIRTMWVLAPDVRAKAAEELETLLELYPRPLVVLQVRGGDKVGHEVDPYTLDAGIAALARNASNRNGTCIVLGDDSALGEQAANLSRAHLGCDVVNRIPPRHRHVQREFYSETPRMRCLRTRQLLVDIELMAHADAFAGLVASNVVRIATLIRHCTGPGLSNAVDWQLRDLLQEACRP